MESLSSILGPLRLDAKKFTTNPVDEYRSHISELLADLTGGEPAVIKSALQSTQILGKGDLNLAVPALRLPGNPNDTARKIQEEFPSNSPLVERPIVDRSFVQFFFKPAPLAAIVLPLTLDEADSYGRDPTMGLRDPNDPSNGPKRIVIDFGSPNIAKPFHQGHLRSTIIGGFLANVYEQSGWDVVRLNYLGDWGKQYGVLGVGFLDYGSQQELERDPIDHLFQVYVEISALARKQKEDISKKEAHIAELKAKNEPIEALEAELQTDCYNSVDERARRYFKQMCDGDGDALRLWSTFRELSIEQYKKTFARLNIHYDVYDGESQIKEASMKEAARILEEKGFSEESQGARIVDLTKYSKKLGKAIVQKKDGTSIYLTRDIGAVFERFEKYRYDKMIYVIANQQDLHMMQLIKIIELMGRPNLAESLQHVNFGLVAGMSTRKGTVKFLDDILRDAADKMHEVMRANESKYTQVKDPEKTADILGISAVIVQDMSGKRINGYTFDMDRMTSFEGDTGPYLQYSHARLCSIIRKADVQLEELKKAEFSLLTEKHATDLVRTLAQWPDVFRNTYKTQEPVTVLTYLFKLTHALNSSYDHLNVLKSETEVKRARLALYCSVKNVLCSGMKILGLNPVTRVALEGLYGMNNTK
ncbi:putative arginyl-tRNA synthetase, cytoplasmic [Corynespora cassiicola Philippines]|uniref:arginine--tRNA ligase n=1 Tax=Corynespora cassiicola Philippines TaxID=1448308 RepID=A0A2T2NCJ2_CORCC|nr:putative arginyl-tRNA synthetase, cytoplasmic [Corynespora cassiicola Philippines]